MNEALAKTILQTLWTGATETTSLVDFQRQQLKWIACNSEKIMT